VDTAVCMAAINPAVSADNQTAFPIRIR
jgi:hypothetical protein